MYCTLFKLAPFQLQGVIIYPGKIRLHKIDAGIQMVNPMHSANSFCTLFQPGELCCITTGQHFYSFSCLTQPHTVNEAWSSHQKLSGFGHLTKGPLLDVQHSYWKPGKEKWAGQPIFIEPYFG